MGLIYLVHLAIQALIWLIIIDALLTWVPGLIDPRNSLVVFLRKITRPLLAPFRQLLPPEKTGYVDLSPMLAFVVLTILDKIIISI